MRKTFKQLLIDIVGRELESNGFQLTSVKSYHGYPIYHRKSNFFIEIIQFGKDRYEPKLIVSCSIVYLDVDEDQSNIHYPSFNQFSDGDLAKICVDDCKEKFFMKGHFGKYFYFGDIYLALGRGIVGVSDGAKKPCGIRIKRLTSQTYEKVAKLIMKRLDLVYNWLTIKRAKKCGVPYSRIVEIMKDKQLDFGEDKIVQTVIYSKEHDQRYVVIYDKGKKFFTYALERMLLYDKEEWRCVCRKYDALPAYWATTQSPSYFGTLEEVVKEIKSDPTYKTYCI